MEFEALNALNSRRLLSYTHPHTHGNVLSIFQFYHLSWVHDVMFNLYYKYVQFFENLIFWLKSLKKREG